MISSSSGLMVWIFIISASIFCFSNSFAACKDSQTKCPVATIVTSFPGLSNIPFPILKPKSSVVKLGTEGRPNLKYTGPLCSATARVALFVWLKSQVFITVIPGSIFINPISSKIW